ncbi:hypothetical protein PGLA_20580 [Paenibacillus glacialis]|uniref:Uncharacterized protein n=1 Tax=Paenibacillus glacialis TaxID=494026 RepID=A0A168H372_9BACL|nr:hypothetical protein PGLA_20580 [Paenibacillus glacialis]
MIRLFLHIDVSGSVIINRTIAQYNQQNLTLINLLNTLKNLEDLFHLNYEYEQVFFACHQWIIRQKLR